MDMQGFRFFLLSRTTTTWRQTGTIRVWVFNSRPVVQMLEMGDSVQRMFRQSQCLSMMITVQEWESDTVDDDGVLVLSFMLHRVGIETIY